MRFEPTDPRTLDLITLVVQRITADSQIDPGSLMVVGAEARNILHDGLGHTFAVRATTDIDIAFALSEWDEYERVMARYPRVGDTDIRVDVAGVKVDMIPFGGIENPTGLSRPKPRKSDLSVFAFTDVFSAASTLRLPSGEEIHIPTPAGYAVLKMRAWLDRSAWGEYRDATDLALATYWYEHSDAVARELYETDAGHAILEENAWDRGLAATALLDRDIRGVLSEETRIELDADWRRADLRLLARYFSVDSAPNWSNALPRRLAYLERLGALHP